MAAEDRDAAGLLADLWDLVEGWSSGAIQRTREASADASPDVVDAEIRLLVAHAAELRGVIEAHLAAEESSAEAPGSSEPERAPEPAAGPILEPVAGQPAGSVAVPVPAPEVAGVSVATVAVPAASHACNSADFDRPPCAECSGRHWYCSICGARRDDCSAAS